MAQMGVPVTGLRDIELYWKELEAQYGQTRIPPELIIGGRATSAKEICESLAAGRRLIAIQGESPEEACNFIAAVVRQTTGSNGELLKNRTIFLDTPEAAEWISGLQSEHVIVPTTVESRRRAFALPLSPVCIIDLRDRHSPGRQPNPAPILLGDIHLLDAHAALESAEIPPPAAKRIAHQSRGSLTALLWGLSLGSDETMPWCKDHAAVDLLPLLLVGRWDTANADDRAVVARLAATTYEEAEKIASNWEGASGPMIRRGNIWDWKALDFAWKELAPKLSQNLLGRFRDEAIKVLGMADPAVKLPAGKRRAAPIYGVTHPYSEQLRSGLVTSLIQLALHDKEIPTGLGQASVDRLVSDLLSPTKLPRADAWCSLAYWLPDLAEASPESFLKCAEDLLKDSAAVPELFEESGLLGGHSAHTYLLWALERLAWPQQYFFRVIRVLARLSELDAGGTTANRPANTLSDIFLPARPRTNIDDAGRFNAICSLYNSFSEVTWGVGPKPHATHYPRWLGNEYSRAALAGKLERQRCWHVRFEKIPPGDCQFRRQIALEDAGMGRQQRGPMERIIGIGAPFDPFSTGNDYRGRETHALRSHHD